METLETLQKLIKGGTQINRPAEDIEEDWINVDHNISDPNINDDFILVKESQLPKNTEEVEEELEGIIDLSQLSKDIIYPNKEFINQDLLREAQEQKSIKSKFDQQNDWVKIQVPEDRVATRLGLKFMIRKGVPDEKRSETWFSVTGTKGYLNTGTYETYLQKLNHVFGERIPTRVLKPPTFGEPPFLNHFLTTKGKEACKRILCVLGMEYPNITYAPTLPELVCLFLQYYSEEDTFYMANKLVINSLSEEPFIPLSKKAAQKLFFTFDQLVEKHCPKVWDHMKTIGMETCDEFLDSWILHLFVSELPYHTFLCILDSYLSEGNSVLLRVGISILSLHLSPLTMCDSKENFINMLHQITPQILDEVTFIKFAFNLKFRRNSNTLKNYHIQKLQSIQEPLYPVYYRPKIEIPPKLFPEEMFQYIYEWLPVRLRIQDPVLVYTLEKEGYSVKNFLNKISQYDYTLLVMKSEQEVFGFFVDSPWDSSSLIGSGACFLFSMTPVPIKYEPNLELGFVKNFLYIIPNGFRFGVGRDGVALTVTDDWCAFSEACDLFQSPPLGPKNCINFVISAIEVYTFK